jgi:hypothetical protein
MSDTIVWPEFTAESTAALAVAHCIQLSYVIIFHSFFNTGECCLRRCSEWRIPEVVVIKCVSLSVACETGGKP